MRNHRHWLGDILVCCDRILQYTDGMSRQQFDADQRTIDAVTRNLEIIGEAARNIPEEFRSQFSEIEWRRIIGFRNFAAHVYCAMNLDIIWDIVLRKIPDLRSRVEKILESEE